MNDAVAVAVVDGQKQLVDHRLHALLRKRPIFEVSFEIIVNELENEVEFVLARNNILQGDNVRVLELLEQGDLPNGS